MKINKELLESLFEGDIKIENIFIMELVTACDSMPDSFWGVFNDNYKEVLSTIGLTDKDTSKYGDLREKCDLLDFLHDNKVSGVLIRFYTTVPRDFTFRGGSEYPSWNSSWGWSIQHFAYGQSIEDAISNAIVIQENYLTLCLERAKADFKDGNNDK